ncbi:hypothetical protein GAMM_290008 [Gammaproteobacteria bacterium]
MVSRPLTKYKKNKSYSSLNNNISEAKNKQLGKDVPKFIPLQIAADIIISHLLKVTKKVLLIPKIEK